MNKPPVHEGAFFALIAALLFSISISMLTPLMTIELAIRLSTSFLTLAYIFYLIKRSHQKIGRLTMMLSCVVLLLVTWLVGSTEMVFVLTHILLIWLTRCLYFYYSLIPCVIDAVLQTLALGTANWAAIQTESPFLVAWTFFLVQGLFTLIPILPVRASKQLPAFLKAKSDHDRTRNSQQFEAAASQAKNALDTLFTQ